MKYEFHTTPFEHQIRALRASWGRDTFALFMQMGTGKTKVILDSAAAMHEEGKICALLVVAPKGSYRTWESEAAIHIPERVKYKCHLWRSGGEKKLDALLEAKPKFPIFIMNVEAFSRESGYLAAEKFLKTYQRTMLVVDESVTIKGPRAMRSRALLSLSKLASVRRILSGAPITQSPLDLYTQCAFLDPKLLGFGSYYAFRNRYAIMRKVTFNGRVADLVVGYKNLDELKERLAGFSFRVTKDECLDLPDKLYQRREVALSEEQARVYKELKRFAMAELEGGKLISTTHVLTRLMRLHQVVLGYGKADDAEDPQPLPHGRVDALVEVIEDSQGKMIIWCFGYNPPLREVALELRKRYGPESTVTYFGETTVDERKQAVELFEDPKSSTRFFVANETAAKGLTLVQAQTVVYYANTYNLDTRGQSEDRAHRIGQKNPVTYVDLVTPETVDERVLEALVRKQNLADLVVSRGLEELS